MRFTIIGKPITKKNSSRIFFNKRTGSRFVMPSAQSVDWTTSAVDQLTRAGADTLQLCQPLNLRAFVFRGALRGDLVNYLQAICDALQACGAVQDDKWITQFDGSRLLLDRVVPRVEIELTII
jgi:Holliday junction resolvase RusA-like endonuclease